MVKKKFSKRTLESAMLSIFFIIVIGLLVVAFARIRLGQQEILHYCSLCASAPKIDNGLYYSYTRAYCFEDVGNVTYCADFYVECNGNDILNVTRITDVIMMGGDWHDKRTQVDREIHCRV